MGCDRNLFTLRLVLNQTRGEWRWQAAAQGWGRRGKWITEKQRGYATLHRSSITPSAGQRGQLAGSQDGQEEEDAERSGDDGCPRDRAAAPPALDGMIMRQCREPL